MAVYPIMADNISNSAGTGAPNFPLGLTGTAAQVLQFDTITNAAGSGAPNFSQGLTCSTAKTATFDKFTNVAGTAGSFPTNGILGVSDGSNAISTSVGRTELTSQLTPQTMTIATATTITSLSSLNAGDWLITIFFQGTTSANITGSALTQIAIGTTTNSFSGTTAGLNQLAVPQVPSTVSDMGLTLSWRTSISTSTTYYLVAQINGTTGGTVKGYGTIFAYRIR